MHLSSKFQIKNYGFIIYIQILWIYEIINIFQVVELIFLKNTTTRDTTSITFTNEKKCNINSLKTYIFFSN